MTFLALPEEQVELLQAAHRERPMKAVARLSGLEPDPYRHIRLDASTLIEVMRNNTMVRGARIHIFLRDAALPGDFIWRPHPNPKIRRDLDFVHSLCVEMDLSVQIDDKLIAGGIGIAGKGWYDDIGLDVAVPRSLKTFLDRKLQRLCPYRAVSPWTLSALESGKKTLKSVAKMLAHVSPGAMRFREEGGHLLDPERGKLDWEYELIDPSRYK